MNYAAACLGFLRPIVAGLSCFLIISCSSGSSSPSDAEVDFAGMSVAVVASVTEGAPPLEVTFSLAENGTNIRTAYWSFGDGSTLSSEDGPVTHTYYGSGEFSASVALDTNDSATPVILTVPITVFGVKLVASVTEGDAPLDVTFSLENGANITSVYWDFGDGSTLSSEDGPVTHTFDESGEYSVSVSVDTNDSATPVVLTVPITTFGGINLIVSSFAIDSELTPGTLETVSAIIQNIGSDPFTHEGNAAANVHIDVGYFLSTDDNITIDDIYIGDTSIVIGTFFTQGDIPFGFQTLAPGENYQYDHQLAVKGNVPAGTYYAGAIVDYIDEFDWYTFPRSTDTLEFTFPTHVVVTETNEEDNVRVLPAHQVSVSALACIDDAYESDDSSGDATEIEVGQTQEHNFCFDNSDWLKFDAIQGGVYKITTFALENETDTQLILYDTDATSILLFHDNLGNTADETRTVDLESNFPPEPASEIVWEAQADGTYFIKVRTTACDEDKDDHCETLLPSLAREGFGSPDGVGLDTGYRISLQ